MLFIRALPLCCLRTALFTALALSPVLHTQAHAQTHAHAQAQAIRVAVPAGPLPESINVLAQQLGIAVVMDETQLSHLTSKGLQGEYTAAQALEKLLAGSGFLAQQTAQGFVIRAQEKGVLSAVKISATTLEERTEGTGSLTTGGPVTSATGLGLTLRETPQSVTVVTRERIDQQNLNSLADIAEQVTGVHYHNKGTAIGGRTLMYARGYEVDSYQVDGVNVPWETLAESERYGHGSLDTAIYDSVTVVRGSTGLLTGTGDPSALMALTRKKPTQERQTLVEVSLGSWSHYRGMLDIGGALNASGSLRGRVVGAYDQSETWVENYSNDRSILYGVLEADLGERTLLTLSLEHGNADSKGAPWAEDYGNYFYFDDDETPIPKSTTNSIAPHWSYLNSDRTYFSASLDHAFNNRWKAKLTYAYGQFNSDMRRGMVNGIPEDGSPTIARVLSLDNNYDTHIVDAQLSGKYPLFGREHELVVGLNLYRNDQAGPLGFYDDRRGLGVVSASWNNGRLRYTDPDWNALPGSSGDYPYDIKTRQEGAYIATRLRPADRLSLILGGRVTSWEYFYADRATPDHDYYVYSDMDHNNEFTPYAGAVWDFTDSLSAYASYTRIFKPQENRDITGALLDPEEGITVETGLKGAWFDGRLNASAAVFESKRDNYAVELRNSEGPILTDNGDQAYRAAYTKGRGWELEVAGELVPGWNLQAGYTRFKNEGIDGANLDPTQPEQMFKLYTDYRVVPNLIVGGSLRWQGDTTTVVDWSTGNPAFDTIDSYVLVGANVGYEVSQQLSFDLAINNLLDKEHRVSNYSHSYGAERNFTLKTRYVF